MKDQDSCCRPTHLHAKKISVRSMGGRHRRGILQPPLDGSLEARCGEWLLLTCAPWLPGSLASSLPDPLPSQCTPLQASRLRVPDRHTSQSNYHPSLQRLRPFLFFSSTATTTTTQMDPTRVASAAALYRMPVTSLQWLAHGLSSEFPFVFPHENSRCRS